jgi:hypothetical protein
MNHAQSSDRINGLQFRRSGPASERDEEVSTTVDWADVRRVMDRVDPTGELSDPSFDPLKRALKILSSYTSAGDLDEVGHKNVEFQNVAVITVPLFFP